MIVMAVSRRRWRSDTLNRGIGRLPARAVTWPDDHPLVVATAAGCSGTTIVIVANITLRVKLAGAPVPRGGHLAGLPQLLNLLEGDRPEAVHLSPMSKL